MKLLPQLPLLWQFTAIFHVSYNGVFNSMYVVNDDDKCCGSSKALYPKACNDLDVDRYGPSRSCSPIMEEKLGDYLQGDLGKGSG